MRITYLHQYFKTPEEAGGIRSYEFARRLARDGHRVTVVCGGHEAGRFETAGFRVVRLPVPYENEMSSGRRMVAMAQFMVRSIWAAVRLPADIVVATSTPLTVAVPGILASWLRRARFVFEVRDLWPSVPYQLGILRDGFVYRAARLLERLTYRRADHVVALSPGMADGVRSVNPSVPLSVVPNAADHEVFAHSADQVQQIRRDLGWSPDERVAVYAGSFGRSYDVVRWVEVAARSQRWKFVVIGAGALTGDALATARRLGVHPTQVLPGSLPKQRVARYLAAADVALSSLDQHPALEVNSLNKVFDALAAGRPVAFSHDGWLPAVLTEHGAGWRLPDGVEAAARFFDELSDADIARAAARADRLGREMFGREELYRDFRRAVLGETSTDD